MKICTYKTIHGYWRSNCSESFTGDWINRHNFAFPRVNNLIALFGTLFF